MNWILVDKSSKIGIKMNSEILVSTQIYVLPLVFVVRYLFITYDQYSSQAVTCPQPTLVYNMETLHWSMHMLLFHWRRKILHLTKIHKDVVFSSHSTHLFICCMLWYSIYSESANAEPPSSCLFWRCFFSFFVVYIWKSNVSHGKFWNLNRFLLKPSSLS